MSLFPGLSNDEKEALGNQKYFDSNLSYNYAIMTPDSKEMFPELNKDIAISNIDKRWQRVILIKSRLADYIRTTFTNCVIPGYIKNEKGELVLGFLKDEKDDTKLKNYVAPVGVSFIRDCMAIAVTSQGVNAMLIKQITENNATISHSYDMDKKYKKNIGGD